jgi:hypothetical protein
MGFGSAAALTVVAVLAGAAVISRPAGRLFRAATWLLTLSAFGAIALATAMILRGRVDTGLAALLGAIAVVVFTTAMVNTRRLDQRRRQLRRQAAACRTQLRHQTARQMPYRRRA